MKPLIKSKKEKNIMLRYIDIELEKYESSCLDAVIARISPFSEMTDMEKYFLNGIVRYLKPKKILEVGVSAGGSSAIILNAIKDIPESKLISVDYCVSYYKDQTKKTGFVIENNFPKFLNQWELLTGGDIAKFIHKIGSDIDMLLLDTVHSHPWETMNFLTVLPFLSNGAWVVLHDISMYLDGEDAFACKYLFDYVTSENKVAPLSEHVPNIFPNIGAFQITPDTHKYIRDVFMSVALPWRDKPDQVNANDLAKIQSVITENYSIELVNLFKDAVAAQSIYYNNLRRLTKPQKIKSYLRKNHPNLFYAIRSKMRNGQ